jgi:hypothetical protein
MCFLGTTWMWTLAAGRMSVNARKLLSCLAGLTGLLIWVWIAVQRASYIILNPFSEETWQNSQVVCPRPEQSMTNEKVRMQTGQNVTRVGRHTCHSLFLSRLTLPTARHDGNRKFLTRNRKQPWMSTWTKKWLAHMLIGYWIVARHEITSLRNTSPWQPGVYTEGPSFGAQQSVERSVWLSRLNNAHVHDKYRLRYQPVMCAI